MRITTLFLALMLAACSPGGGDGPSFDSADTNSARPPTKQVTLATDGSRESVMMQLYTPPREFPLQFTTYLPQDFAAVAGLEGQRQTIHITEQASESAGDRAFVHFVVAPPGETEGGVRETVRAVAESYGVPGNRTEIQPIRRHPWAVVEYGFTSRGTLREPVTGWVALGCHGGRWFHLIVQSPVGAEGAGFRARAEQILAAWRWAEGSALQPTVGASRSQAC